MVSKLYKFSDIFFLACSELSFKKNSFPTFWYFFSFFHLVCNFFERLYHPLCWSINCMNWVFKLCNMFWRCPEAYTLSFIWDLSVLLFMESSICTVCNFSDLYLACKLYKSGLYIMHYILDVSRYTNIAYIGVYLVLTYKEKLFSTVCYFFRYFCWSQYCLSRVSKFHIFLPCMLRNWGKVYTGGLLVLSLVGSSSPTFQCFFNNFHLVCKLLKWFF